MKMAAPKCFGYLCVSTGGQEVKNAAKKKINRRRPFPVDTVIQVNRHAKQD